MNGFAWFRLRLPWMILHVRHTGESRYPDLRTKQLDPGLHRGDVREASCSMDVLGDTYGE